MGESFRRPQLGVNVCHGLQRTPVDYAMRNPDGWQQNPHYKAFPPSRFQPLGYGPIDFYEDERRLAKGELFLQYRNDWQGCGNPEYNLVNDSMNRFNVADLGDLSRRRRMDDAWSPAFGPNKAQPFTESALERVDNTRQKIYGGNKWLHFNRLQSS